MNTLFMENQPAPSDPNRLLGEARRQVLSEGDPVGRLEMLQGMIAEGGHDLVDFAVAAYDEIPSHSADEPEQVDGIKIAAARTLIRTLADQKLFTQAEAVFSKLGRLDPSEGTASMIDLLRAGYAGRRGRFLNVDMSDHIVPGKRPPPVVFSYFEGLARYGVDLLDPNGKHGPVFSQALRQLSQVRRDRQCEVITYEYSQGGRLDLATALRQTIQDPFLRSRANLCIAQQAQDIGNEQLASELMAEIREDIISVANCDSSCGRTSCNPARDTREIEAGLGVLFAKRGDASAATELAGTPNPSLVNEQMVIHLTNYEQHGDVTTRTAVIASLKEVGILADYSVVADDVRRIALADKKWGHTVPSLYEGDRDVPLICWELNTLYGPGHGQEEQPQDTALGIGVYPVGSEEPGAGQIELRDYLLADLLKIIATDAPTTAATMMDLIETPPQKVRAMAIIGRAQSAALTAESTEGVQPQALGGSDGVLSALKEIIDTMRHDEDDK